jgi:hypothetical protein
MRVSSSAMGWGPRRSSHDGASIALDEAVVALSPEELLNLLHVSREVDFGVCRDEDGQRRKPGTLLVHLVHQGTFSKSRSGKL